MKQDSGISGQTHSKSLAGLDPQQRSLTSAKTSLPLVQRSSLRGGQSVRLDVANQGGSLKSARTGLHMSTRSKPCGGCLLDETDPKPDCQECDFHGASTQALYRHMKQEHPHAKLYQCVVCGLWFNTLHD